MQTPPWLTLSRLAIGLVTGVNLQCAVFFIFQPAKFSASFELVGEPGATAVRGIGILFLMWSVPYVVAMVHPVRHSLSLWQAVVMQSVGLLGETLIWLTLSSSHPILRASIARFIVFDAAGLGLLCLSVWFARQARQTHQIRRVATV